MLVGLHSTLRPHLSFLDAQYLPICGECQEKIVHQRVIFSAAYDDTNPQLDQLIVGGYRHSYFYLSTYALADSPPAAI